VFSLVLLATVFPFNTLAYWPSVSQKIDFRCKPLVFPPSTGNLGIRPLHSCRLSKRPSSVILHYLTLSRNSKCLQGVHVTQDKSQESIISTHVLDKDYLRCDFCTLTQSSLLEINLGLKDFTCEHYDMFSQSGMSAVILGSFEDFCCSPNSVHSRITQS
jgi:hypothetical protein